MPSHFRRTAAACVPLVSLVFATAATAQAPAGCAGAQQAPTAKTMAGARVATLCLINRERAAYGLAPLTEAPVIGWTAQAHSDLMVSLKFFAHSKGVARSLAGLYWAWGQNIAWAEDRMAAPETVVAAWMVSPAHRRNILSADYDHIGIGITMGAPETTPLAAATYATDFGASIRKPAAEPPAESPADAAAAERQAPAPAPASSPTSDAMVVAPAVAPPGAERPMRPPVRAAYIKKAARACAARSRARRGRSTCVKRRPKVTIKTRRGGGGTSLMLQPPS